ncbi:DUF1064 domain-containing protein [Rummeliibacillus sp. TYF005]|uniref:DUF1064 domain-containing protein n=1 Tax=Rummeliibacillus sp. TYF005 TaxID=2058214 RepID=UPI000F53A2B7|nr:DUF1064 domain-containing protein [Rummeliibacillus sp. TYF005]RPJ97265.1 DUF1064 domain-containing protein [Rummeliibacillus sp. TYF005]
MTSKYKNKKVEVDGITFDSKMESDYYLYLKQLEQQGAVREFLMQKEYILLEGYVKSDKKIRPIKYKADFEVHYSDGHIEVVDVKGFLTADFKLKKKLFEYRFPFVLKLVKFSKIDGGWIELEDYEKARKERKKQKLAK